MLQYNYRGIKLLNFLKMIKIKDILNYLLHIGVPRQKPRYSASTSVCIHLLSDFCTFAKNSNFILLK